MVKIAQRFFLGIFGITLGLVLAEIGFRVVLQDPTPDDEFVQPQPLFGWFHIPYKKGWVVGKG
jgi:hypothetical protein